MTTEADHFYLTRPEIRQLSDKLKNLVWMATDLDNVIVRDTCYTDNTIPGKSADDPLMFNETASDLAWELRDLLRTWTLHICTHRQREWPGEQRAEGFAKWIDRHLIDLALTEEAPQAADEIRDITKRLTRCIDRPQPKEFAGHCQSDVEGITCKGVYVYPGSDMHLCKLCDVQCDVAKMQTEVRAEMAGKHVGKKELATALTIMLGKEVPYERVRNWIRRGQLRPVNDGGDLYNLDHAHMLALQTKRRAS